MILGLLGLIFGLFPAWVDAGLLLPAAQSIANTAIDAPLKIWHGFNLVLLLSVITIVAGTTLYILFRPSNAKAAFIRRFDKLSTEYLFNSLNRIFVQLAAAYTTYWHNGYLRSYLFKILSFAAIIIAIKLIAMGIPPLDMELISPISVYEVVVTAILIAGVFLTILTPSRLTAVVGTSVIGYSIYLLFILYSAPDLALTQFTIDTLTVVLFVLVLFRLPPFLKFANRPTKIRDTTLAVGFGAVVAITALHVLHEPVTKNITGFYGDNAYRLAKGKNVVNVILVDFRGLDTMFEIVVLSIAAIGVYSLLKLRIKPSDKE